MNKPHLFGRRITTPGSVFVLLLHCLAATCLSSELFVGEPLGEAMYDLNSVAVLIGHDLNGASALKRTDVYRMRDGRLLAVTSTAEAIGQPFSIKQLQISSGESPLTPETPRKARVDLPEK
jgi:hypothetical protein